MSLRRALRPLRALALALAAGAWLGSLALAQPAPQAGASAAWSAPRGAASAPVVPPVSPWALSPEAMDPTVRPQDDLYRAANGGWLRATELRPDQATLDPFSDLAEQADARVRALVEGLARAAALRPAAPGTPEQQVGDFFRAYNDEAALERAGLAPLAGWMARIAAIQSRRELARVLGELQGLIRHPLGFRLLTHPDQPERHRLSLWQGGLGLPHRDYYSADDEDHRRARQAYRVYLEALFRLDAQARPAGASLVAEAEPASPAESAEAVLALETRLAAAQLSTADSRKPQAFRQAQLRTHWSRQAPGLDWEAFARASALPPALRELNFAQPDYVRTVAQAVADTPLPVWRRYLRVRLWEACAELLPADWRQARFEFHGRALQGRREPVPRWRLAVDALNGALGQTVGRLYVARHFPEAQRQRVQAMVDQIRATLAESIGHSSRWQPGTRRAALDKLARLRVLVGYPRRWADERSLRIRADDPVGNLLRAGRREHQRQVARAGQAVDRDLWWLTPQTVNAEYTTRTNVAAFPAALLAPPFFDPAADDAQNYGAIGAIISHEISHGFDDRGSRFDARGRVRDWWTAADRHDYEARAQRLVAQYDAYEGLPGHRVNGRQTLSENIADLAGVELAWRAWQRSQAGRPRADAGPWSPAQRFFLSWAGVWRSRTRPEVLLQWLTGDIHAPDEFRANGTVIHLDGFHQAFGTQPGDALYRPPTERIHFW